MKKTALILTFALAAAACSTDYTPDAERTPGMVRLSFRAMIPSTKTITGTGDMREFGSEHPAVPVPDGYFA